jgi:hypothetical protein
MRTAKTGKRTNMRFILVNHMVLRRPSTCSECLQSLGPGYVRDMSMRLPYRDFGCYRRYEKKNLSMLWVAAVRTEHAPANNYRSQSERSRRRASLCAGIAYLDKRDGEGDRE